MELAVEEFQADNALPPTGALDDATHAQLVNGLRILSETPVEW